MTTLEQGQTALVTKPTARFMQAHPSHWIAQGFGSGLSRVMPGTVGTLFAWLSFSVLSTRWPQVFTDSVWAGVIVVGFALGIWACAKTARDLGTSDCGSIVWDEIIAFWLVLLMVTPADFWTQFWAFACFRLFDMVKPPPISYLERRFDGGFGVMVDDLAAAFFTLLVIALWRTF